MGSEGTGSRSIFLKSNPLKLAILELNFLDPGNFRF